MDSYGVWSMCVGIYLCAFLEREKSCTVCCYCVESCSGVCAFLKDDEIVVPLVVVVWRVAVCVFVCTCVLFCIEESHLCTCCYPGVQSCGVVYVSRVLCVRSLIVVLFVCTMLLICLWMN